MTPPSPVTVVRRMWEGLADARGSFGDGVRVVVAPASLVCPPGFVGIVTIGDGALVAAPDETLAGALRIHLAGREIGELTEPALFADGFVVDTVLGPARLAYASTDTFRPAHEPGRGTQPPEPLAGDDPDMAFLRSGVDPEEAGESGIDGITSPAFVERDDTEKVVAAAGYRMWPGDTAQLCVLTAPAARGRGAARRVASRAVEHALANRLLPQWRARTLPSIRVADRLGFIDLGGQLSVQLTAMKGRA